MRFETFCALQAHAARLDVCALYTFLLRERFGKERRAKIERLWIRVQRESGMTPEAWKRRRERQRKREAKDRRETLKELAGLFGEM